MRRLAAIVFAIGALVTPACDSEPEIEDRREINPPPGIDESPADEEN